MKTGLLLLTAIAAFAQAPGVVTTAGPAANRAVSGSATFGGGGTRFAIPPIQGAPYSAEEIQERQQTLSDGTHITQTPSHQIMYRDSQGRTRVERPIFMGPNAPESPTVVEITDPLAGVQYTLDPQNKVVHRMTVQPFSTRPNVSAIGGGTVVRQATAGAVSIPAPAQGRGGGSVVAVGPEARAASRSITTEKLGNQTMEGVLVEGQRQVMTIPAGAEGNDRDFSVITETWTSPDLRTVVYRKSSDPRSGDSIMRLTNISRNEPDPQLFLPPADYQVVDETGPFTIRFGQQ